MSKPDTIDAVIQFTHSQLLLFVAAYKDSIASVHQDGGVIATDIQYNAPWALDRIDQGTLPLNGQYSYFSSGSNVNVYIIDTGIRTSHDEFGYADGSPGSRAREVFASLSSGIAGQDCNGHGTHVAATVGGLTYGPAKNVTLLAVRALECLGNGTVAQVIQGLEWVKDNFVPPAAVVMALGGESQYALDLAVAEVVQAGVPVMVAAGNEDTDACLTSPAREPLAITVSATDQNDSRLWVGAGTGANYGTCVDIWAPGYGILSAGNTADNATQYRSGTSQAVPFVAGAVAIYLQNNTDASPLEVKTALMSSGSWGVVHESNASGPLNAGVLNYTDDVLVNTAMFHAVNFEPQSIQITGGANGFGPFFVNVTLAQAPVGSVAVAVSLSNVSRAMVAPQQLLFTLNNWSTPQLLNLTTAAEAYHSVDSDDFYIQLDLTSNDPDFNNTHPRLQVSDSKGDTVEYPKAILSLPFSDQGNTYFFTDDYNIICGNQNSTASAGSKDVAYFFQPQEDCTVTIATCNSAEFVDDFDTVVYVLGNASGPGLMEVVGCNDDACSYLSRLQVNMTAGSAYAIVVDGYGGKFGQYQIDITAQQGPVNGTAPPSNLGTVNVPTNDLVTLSPGAAPEGSPTEEAASAGAEESPPTVTVPDISTGATASTASDSSQSVNGGNLALVSNPSNASVLIPGTNGTASIPSPSAQLNGTNPSSPTVASPGGATATMSPLMSSPAPPSVASRTSSSPASPAAFSPTPIPLPSSSSSASSTPTLVPSSSSLPPLRVSVSSPSSLQISSPGQGLSAVALLAQMSPSPGAPVPPLLIPFAAQTGLPSSAEAAMAPVEATGPNAGQALACQASACPPLPSSSSPFNNPSPLIITPSQPTTITPLPSPVTMPEPTPQSFPSSASLQQTPAQTLGSANSPLASSPSVSDPIEPPVLSPTPSSNPSYGSAMTPVGSASVPGPEMLPASALPYGIPLPIYASFSPAPGPAPMPAPAPAPEPALALAAAAGGEAAPSSPLVPRMLLPSQPDSLSSPFTSAATALAPGGSAASSGLSRGGADVAAASVGRDDASVSPAGNSGTAGRGGLGTKDIGIMVGVIAAGAVLLGSVSSHITAFLPNALLASGVGLYAHMVSRRRQRTGAKGAACTKEAEGDQAASKSVSSQPSVPIAQSKLPLGGLFEPVGCPRLGSPCRREPQSFIQSLASSTRSRSKLSCSLRLNPGAAAVPAVSAVHVQADSFDSRHQPQHAQQALPGMFPAPAPHSIFNASAKRGSAAGSASSALLPQHAQHVGLSSQHVQQAADDALSQEAAAAEAVLDSFSRMSSAEVLQSYLRSGPATHLTQPATASTAATQEAQQSAGPEPAQVAAQQQPAGLAKTAAQQQQPPLMAQLGKGKLGAGSSMKPQQGYPGQQAGLPCGKDSKLLSEAQVKALSSLEVARQRQSNRAQLHLGQQPLVPGPLQRAGLLCPKPAGPLQAAGLLCPKQAGPLQASGRMEQPSEPLGSALQQADPAQQARAKLEAIRRELGVLEKARRSMLQQQPGAVANQLRGSQAQVLQLQLKPTLAPRAAVRAAGQAPAPQRPAQQAKPARLAGSKLPSSYAGAVDNAAANASARTASASTNRAVSASGSAMSVAGSYQAAASSGMTWNPVRLMTPFEKASSASAGDNLTCMGLMDTPGDCFTVLRNGKASNYCMQHAL
ncbi:TPA: hypothetical protein ACH3X1_000835 [Trebouxia sp. C0004]